MGVAGAGLAGLLLLVLVFRGLLASCWAMIRAVCQSCGASNGRARACHPRDYGAFLVWWGSIVSSQAMKAEFCSGAQGLLWDTDA